MVMAICYVAALCAANFSVYFFGPSWTPANAFLLIGLDMFLRDRMHERHGILAASALTALASLISYFFNPAISAIAIASSVSFGIANFGDSVAYQLLRRKKFAVKANGSNLVGAAIDSTLFPLLAFGVFMPEISALQFLAKVSGGYAWSVVFTKGAKFA
ncbi:hypothetical protein D3C85_686490 [compost metagenome]